MNFSLPRSFFPVIIFMMIILFPQCKKDTPQNEIPFVSVSIAIDPNSTEYIRLNTVNGWEYLKGGYSGIIVFRASANGFLAFERACPYDWDKTTTRINVDSSGITTVCPSCNSKFILTDGSPFAGPSPYPMKQYQTNYNGTTLFIYN